jgi:hypothetical protein
VPGKHQTKVNLHPANHGLLLLFCGNAMLGSTEGEARAQPRRNLACSGLALIGVTQAYDMV